MAGADSTPTEVFFSYSHKDEVLADKLITHLALLKRQQVIDDWHDRRIVAGQEWGGRIDDHLNAAAVILLLVSADFLASDYCYDIEMKRALQRHDVGDARVIPVILRSVDWRGAPFAKLQELPKDGKPVTSWPNEDEAFTDVARGIRSAVEELRWQPRLTTTIWNHSTLFGSASESGSSFADMSTPASWPPGSRMTLARNALFVGRNQELKELAKTLKAGQTAAVGQVVAVSGLGGIGKTQLAIEFVHRYGRHFRGGVFWLSFAQAKAVPAKIAACGGAEGMNLRKDFDYLPLKEQLRLVVAEWQGSLPRLLVFDRCEDEALLERWRPQTGLSSVLVTSRRGTWSPYLGVRNLILEELSPRESVELLCRYRPNLARGDPALEAIAAELGNLPLALHLAGSFLARYQHAPLGQPAAYLEAIRRPDLLEHRSLIAEGPSPTRHEQHVARTFALSYDQLRPTVEIEKLALVALARAAWFAAGEAIPRELLRASARVDGEDESSILCFEDGVVRLRELGLIAEQEDGALMLHRLLAAFVQNEAGDGETHRTQVEEAVLAEAARLNQAGYPAPLLDWLPQLRFVAERAAEIDGVTSGSLLHELGYHMSKVADFEAAKAAYERALAIFKRVLGPGHRNVTHTVNSLGRVLHDLNDLAGARAAYEAALKIDEASFGPDHANVAIRVNNLGGVLQDLGDLAGAKAAYERALRIGEKFYEPNDPQVAIYLNNLGHVLRKLGDLAGARSACERALAVDELRPDADHPNVARDVNNLGLVLKEEGDLAGARTAFERALKIDEDVYGPHHPRVAVRVDNLGLVLREQGDLADAKAAHQRALAIDEAVYGRHHPRVAVRVNNLGLVLREEGELAVARAAFERALAIDEASFGPDHPNVARDVINLGSVLRDLGELAVARAAFERALGVFERFLGPEHPRTRTARGNLDSLGG